MSHISVSVPHSRYYVPHLRQRGMYVFADDFFNTTSNNWFSDLQGRVEDKIRTYLQARPFNSAEITEPDNLRDVRHTTWNEPSLETMAGKFINHHVYRVIGDIILNQYEHFDPSIGAIPTKSVTLGQNDELVKNLVSLFIDLSELGDMFKNNIQSVTTSPKWLDRQQNTENKKNINPKGGQIVIHNTNLSKFNLTPDILGADAVSLTGGSLGSSKYAQEIVMNSLVGWTFTGLSERTFGSPQDLNAIFMDVLIRHVTPSSINPRLPTSIEENISGTIFSQSLSRYEELLASDFPERLQSFNSDFTDGDDTIQNPFVLGIIDNFKRVPEQGLFLNIYRVVRTPFYNREVINPNEDATLTRYSKFSHIEYSYTSSTRTTTVKTHRPIPNEDDVKSLWLMLVGDENTEGSLEKALVVGGSSLDGLVTLSGETTSNNNDTDQKLVNRFIQTLRKLPLQAQTSILVNSITGIFNMMTDLGKTEWNEMGNRLVPPTSLSTASNKIEAVENNLEYSINMGDNSIDNVLLIQASNNLRKLLGSRTNSPMGGLSYSWEKNIQVSRMGENIIYPGDSSVLNNMGNYTKMFVGDINKVNKEVEFGMRRLSSMYWWRDIVRSLEIVYTILKPGAMIPAPQKDENYKRLGDVFKFYYGKQLEAIRNYINKIRSLGSGSKVNMSKGTVSSSEDPSKARERKSVELLTSNSICYFKNQILILDNILQLAQTTPQWISADGPRAPYPNMASRNSRLLSSVKSWWRQQTTEYMSRLTDPRMIKIIMKMLSVDYCKQEAPKASSLSGKHLTDEITKQVTQPKFWKALSRTLKGKFNMSLDLPDNKYFGIYVPVYTTTTFGSNINYYIFDIMPYLLNSSLNMTTKSSPQWLSGNSLITSNAFPPSDPGVIIVANKVNNIGNSRKWKAIPAKWFEQVLDAEKKKLAINKDVSKQGFMLRVIVYLLIKDGSAWDRKADKLVGVNSNNMIDVPTGGRMDSLKFALEKIYSMGNSQKKVDNRVIDLTTRDIVEKDLQLARTSLLSE